MDLASFYRNAFHTYNRLSQLISLPNKESHIKPFQPTYPAIILIHGKSGSGKSILIHSLITKPFYLHAALIAAYFDSSPAQGVQFYMFKFIQFLESCSCASDHVALILDNIELFFTNPWVGIAIIHTLRKFAATRPFSVIATTASLDLVPPQFLNIVTDRLEFKETTQVIRNAQLKLATHLHGSVVDYIEMPEEWGKGYVFADVFRLVNAYARYGSNTTVSQLASDSVNISNLVDHDLFLSVDKHLIPDFTTVAGYTHVKNLLRRSVIRPYLHRKSLERLGHTHVPVGIVLYGPPGTGKSQLARCVAGECNIALITTNLSTLVRGLVGESEKQVARLFASAKRCAPCVLVMDEMDAVFSASSSDTDLSSKMTAQFVMEMDALYSDNTDVFVIGTTNYPESLCAPIIRSGRFDTSINVGLPRRKDRELIIQAVADKFNVEMDRCALAKTCSKASCADVLALAGRIALEKSDKL